MDTLTQFRSDLNLLDEQLVELLGRRYELCRQVAHYKREQNIPMMQPARVLEVKERSARLAVLHGVEPEFARRLYAMIIDEACRLEDEIIAQSHAAQTTQAR